MVKFLAGMVLAGLMTMLTPTTLQEGLRDVVQSLTTWNYYPIRDMRRTVAIIAQKTAMLTPPEMSVNRDGPAQVEGDLQTLAATLNNPVFPDTHSVNEGERQYRRTCVPCHGSDMRGDGPVIQFYVPPPDLLGELARSRTDGYIYAYIRNGGAVMPAYGYQVPPEMAWNLVNYIRARQQANPR